MFLSKDEAYGFEALRAAGAQTVLVSPKSGTLQGMKHDEKANEFAVDMKLQDAKPEEFDGVLLPGGALNADHLRVEEEAKRFVQAAIESAPGLGAGNGPVNHFAEAHQQAGI